MFQVGHKAALASPPGSKENMRGLLFLNQQLRPPRGALRKVVALLAPSGWCGVRLRVAGFRCLRPSPEAARTPAPFLPLMPSLPSISPAVPIISPPHAAVLHVVAGPVS